MPSPMLSTVKEQLIKVVDHIPGLRSRRSPMAETPPFKATDNFGHRYQDDKVLRKALIEICGFKDAEIRIQVTEQNGLDAQLPRLVTKQQKEEIFKRYEAAKAAQRLPPKKVKKDNTDGESVKEKEDGQDGK